MDVGVDDRHDQLTQSKHRHSAGFAVDNVVYANVGVFFAAAGVAA